MCSAVQNGCAPLARVSSPRVLRVGLATPNGISTFGAGEHDSIMRACTAALCGARRRGGINLARCRRALGKNRVGICSRRIVQGFLAVSCL